MFRSRNGELSDLVCNKQSCHSSKCPKKKHVLVLPCKIMRHAKKASQLQGAQLLQAVFTGGYLVVLSSITHPG